MRHIKQRLADYRAEAAAGTFSTAKDWKYWRNKRLWAREPTPTRAKDGSVWLERELGDHEAYVDPKGARLSKHRLGYYTDNYQADSMGGSVRSMRTSKGMLYWPSISSSDGYYVGHYLSDAIIVPKAPDNEDAQTAAIRECAHSADYYASRYAECAREDDAKFQAEQQAEDSILAAKALRTQCRALAAELRGLSLPPTVCATLRQSVRTMRYDHSAAYARATELRANYWLAIE